MAGAQSDQFSEKPIPPQPRAAEDGQFADRPLPPPRDVDDEEPSPAEERAAARRASEARIFELRQLGFKGANWFFWVAALSVVNSVLAHGGGNIAFVVGLGTTLVVDGIAKGIGEQNPNLDTGLKIFAIGFAVVVALIVTGVGLLARKGYIIPFAIGMALYLIDGLILLLFFDFMGAAFHAYALYWMWNGLSAFRKIRAIEDERRDAALYGSDDE